MQKKNLYKENKGYNGMVYCNHGDKGSSMIAIHSGNIKVIEKTDF